MFTLLKFEHLLFLKPNCDHSEESSKQIKFVNLNCAIIF